MGHMLQYPEDTTEVFSYLEARKPGHDVIFFGLQYILKKYLSKKITVKNTAEFCKYYESILGEMPNEVHLKLAALIGYHWPIEIRAVAEGTIVPTGNVLLTIRNTHPDFAWCVGFLESLLLKVWYPSTVATHSKKYRDLVEDYARETCDTDSHIPYAVHDFGYRGVSSEESAAIAGAAHLLNFYGSDTVCANKFLDKYYGAEFYVKGRSIPASEHSVMCSYGREHEWDAFDRMLELYPEGPVSIVSDSYDYWSIISQYTASRIQKIMSRKGKVVFRPDSGDPIKVICGDPGYEDYTPQRKGSLEILWNRFGGHVNRKGYRVLDPHVGLIYGDGMYYERFEEMLATMKKLGYASSNLVIGVGGLLLQNHSRDEFGFAIKATHITKRDGTKLAVFKDPQTDSSKRSKRGYMQLYENELGQYVTVDSEEFYEAAGNSKLKLVFKDGALYNEVDYNDIKDHIAGCFPITVDPKNMRIL